MANSGILTTHVGSLPRSQTVTDVIFARETSAPRDVTKDNAVITEAVAEVVRRQKEVGIDVVSDGEMSKPSYTTYIRHRVEGIQPDPRAAKKGDDIMIDRDLMAHPDFGNKQDLLRHLRRAPLLGLRRRHAARARPGPGGVPRAAEEARRARLDREVPPATVCRGG